MLNNKEIAIFTLFFTAITVILALIGFIISPECGIIVIISAAVFGAAFFVFTKRRYKKIADMSEQIDIVLHNEESVFTGSFDEGELAVLRNEISKMTVRIREQNDRLKKEKIFLADSLADIAHQLRTPLTSANIILSLMKNESDEHKRKQLIAETRSLYGRMNNLLTALLQLSRIDAGIVEFQHDSISVKRLINSALEPVEIPMELHNIEILTEIPEESYIIGDCIWLSEAIQNILKNCMESIGDNGSIKIICEDTLLYTMICIYDSGKGFNEKDLPHIFDRFYSGKGRNTSSYGIGLALSRSIIMKNGGTVSAKNYDGGALFQIKFPK